MDVTERNEGFEIGIDGNLINVFLLLHAFGSGGNARQNRETRHHERGLECALDGSAVGFRHPSPVDGFDLSDQDSDGQDGDGGGDGGGISLVHRLRRQGRILLGRSGRRQRRREASGVER